MDDLFEGRRKTATQAEIDAAVAEEAAAMAAPAPRRARAADADEDDLFGGRRRQHAGDDANGGDARATDDLIDDVDDDSADLDTSDDAGATLEEEANEARDALLGVRGASRGSKRRSKSTNGELLDIETLELDLGTMDMTSIDIDFDELDADLQRAQNDELLGEALHSANLRQFTRDLGEKLRDAESAAIPPLLEQAEEFAALYNDLEVCDKVLEQFESLLDGFRTDLGGLSADIQRLQDSSMAKSVGLKNRKQVSEILKPQLRELSIGKHITRKLQSAPIDDRYLTYLQELNRKISTLATSANNDDDAPSKPPSRASEDARRQIAELQTVVVKRLRQHLLSNLAGVKSLEQMRSFQQRFNRHGAFYQFLFKHDTTTAQTLLNQYVEHGCRIYNEHLSSYLTSLLKLKASPTIGKKDLIGLSDDRLKKFFSSKLSNLKRETQPFALGDRESIVAHLFDPPYVISDNSDSIAYEEIFRSFFFELTELIANETIFIQDFFLCEVEQLHEQIFGRTLQQFEQHLDKYLNSCFDALTILTMLCATGQFKRATNRRMVTILNEYYDNVYSKLWFRFTELVQMHVVSVQKATAKNLGLSPTDALPHYVTRRYAEWISAAAQLANHLVDQEPLHERCKPLVVAMDELLARLAAALKPELQNIFMINNYALIVSLLEERKAPQALLQPPSEALRSATRSCGRNAAKRHFEQLITITNEIKRATKAAGGNADADKTEESQSLAKPSNVNEARVAALAASFENEYEAQLLSLRDDTLQHFASFATGMRVFSETLTFVYELYELFARFVAQHFRQVRCVAPVAVKASMQSLVANFLSK